MGKFTDYINEHFEEYKSIPFWSWNDELDPKELKRQIGDMKRLNMGGFFMHARSGLETEYQSDEWYDCITECVNEAKKQDMQAWAYDENGWPSGFAGGKLLEDEKNHARYLEYAVLDRFDSEALGVYTLNDGKIERVFGNIGKAEYHTVYRRSDVSYVDTMDADITRKFIALTHEEYKKRTGDDFGKTMPGFFTDEPQYYRYNTIWSDTLPREFYAKYGYDVLSMLPALFIDFDGAREFRYDYYRLCHELFINNFIKVIYEWCEENGSAVTGHAIEEKFLAGQMWCCGGIMPFYEYMTIPGVDYLGKGTGNDLSSKQVGSVAAQLGKKKVLSEMFACCGWEVTPRELKQIAEHQYFGGVNLMCQHLYPYSIRGQRKRDYPAFYSEHQTWQEALGDFNLYFARLGAALSCGEEIANVLVIHPIHSAYLDFKRLNDRASIEEIETSFALLTDMLSQNRVAYHYGDEWLMSKYASVKDSKLTVGKCTYDTVVLPTMYTLDKDTAKLLEEYVKQGGRLCAYGTLPDRIDGRVADLSFLKPNVTLEQLFDETNVNITADAPTLHMRCMQRNTPFGKLYYVLNQDKHPIENVTVEFKNAASLSVIDLETMTQTPLCGNVYKADFDAVESKLFIEEESSANESKSSEPLVNTPFLLKEIPENQFKLDYARRSSDGINFSELQPLPRIKDNLLSERYEGKLWLKFEFEAISLPEKLSLAAELLKSCTVSVNGTVVTFGDEYFIDRSIKTAPITHLVKEGVNEIVFEIDYFQRDYVYYVLFGGVSESLRNCLCFDTEIEACYLFGSFEVESDPDKFERAYHDYYIYGGGFKIKKAVGIPDVTDMVKNGYTFFSGSITLEAQRISGNILTVPGDYPVAQVFVDGESVKYLLFDNKCDVSPYIKNGGEKIEVKVFSSRRNLLGPHHFCDWETYAAPPVFSFEKQWDGDKCDAYRDTYSFKKFGVLLK